MDFLTRIRSRSPVIRMQYALGIAALLTGIITAVWISTIPARFADTEAGTPTTTLSVGGQGTTPATTSAPVNAPELDSLNMDATITTTTASSSLSGTTSTPAATTTAPRVIQIGTTSQNAH